MKCEGCNGEGLVGNILNTDTCPFCKGTGERSKEQYAKVTVIVERTYLLPVVNGLSLAGDTAEEITEAWFSNPRAYNFSNSTRDRHNLGNSDRIISAEVTEYIDVPEGTI